jgi:hypothetical protein
MMAAQQIGVTLGDASATEQPELDHDASFFGGAATYPMQSRIERGARMNTQCLYSQKPL